MIYAGFYFYKSWQDFCNFGDQVVSTRETSLFTFVYYLEELLTDRKFVMFWNASCLQPPLK